MQQCAIESQLHPVRNCVQLRVNYTRCATVCAIEGQLHSIRNYVQLRGQMQPIPNKELLSFLEKNIVQRVRM